MPADSEKKKPNLVIVPGGKADAPDFHKLSFPEKLHSLSTVATSQQKMNLMLDDAEMGALVKALPPQELYLIMKDIGGSDALPLLASASSEQITFFLDLDCWDKWSFSREKTLAWLELLIECGDQKAGNVLAALDQEFLILILLHEIIVGGGTGEVITDEERLHEWDHSFDNLFMITYRDPQSSQIIGKVIDILFQTRPALYRDLMIAVRSEIEIEMEELSFKFRSDRLEESGFPQFDEALAVYSLLEPEHFALSGTKELLQQEEGTGYALALLDDDSFLKRVLAAAHSERLSLELNYLINNVLVADSISLSDAQGIRDTMQRVFGWLNVALEYLSGGNVEKGVEIVTTEHLKRLFQLGGGIVSKVRKKAGQLAGDKKDSSYASNKAIIGFAAKRPQFYRGLDADRVDGYREFRNSADVRTADTFLETLQGS